MSVCSMTGFGRGEARGDLFHVMVEIKTVNHRFKDFRFKMPSPFSSLEMELREEINKNFKRGSFEVLVSLKKNVAHSVLFNLDLSKVTSFLQTMVPLLSQTQVPFQVNMGDFLRSEFYLDDEESREKESQTLLRQAFKKAIEEVKKVRINEGQQLLHLIRQHLQVFGESFVVVEQKVPLLQEEIKQRLERKISLLQPDIDFDQGRLRQEIVYYLEKLDVQEEIDRICVHMKKLRRILDQGGEVGRDIDFLLQELQRETHTIGAKTNCTPVAEAIVRMKVQLEKIREQSLNVE